MPGAGGVGVSGRSEMEGWTGEQAGGGRSGGDERMGRNQGARSIHRVSGDAAHSKHIVPNTSSSVHRAHTHEYRTHSSSRARARQQRQPTSGGLRCPLTDSPVSYSSLAGISFESTLALLGGTFAAAILAGTGASAAAAVFSDAAASCARGWSLRSLRSGSAQANAVAPTTGATARRRRDPRRAAIIMRSRTVVEEP